MMQKRMKSSRKEWESRMRERIAQLGCLNLFRGQIGWLASVQPNVLLQDEAVGELFMTNRADVEKPRRWFGSVDAHVGLQVPFGRECPTTNLALERPLARVRPVVHLKSRLAREDSVANDALVRVHQLVFYVVHQLLEFGRVRSSRYLNQTLPGIVV